MTAIRQGDLIQSVADALQYINYYHPMDYITALDRAYEQGQSPAAKNAIAQILTNSCMCAEGKRPIYQDTGIVTVFLEVGVSVRQGSENDNATMNLEDVVNEGVRHVYNDVSNKLRASVLADPTGKRTNTRGNTPAVINMSIMPGDTVDVVVTAKGGGSEAKSKFVMLNPSDLIVDWVLKTVSTVGADWCPPGMLGIGIGGTAERAMLLAKEAPIEPIDIQDLIARGPSNRVEELRIKLCEKVNALGISAQSLDGLATVLDVKILDYPTHAANLPVTIIPNCTAIHHAHSALDGSGIARLEAPDLLQWPKVEQAPNTKASEHVDLNAFAPEEVVSWKPGQTLLLDGKMLTGHDTVHKRITDMLAKGEKLLIDFTNHVIYYADPVDPVRDEVVGLAGPTTAIRMDKFTETMLAQTGLIAIVGKAERNPVAIKSIKKRKSTYLVTVGGATYLVSRAVRGPEVLAFEDLGMEAIYEFDVKDMPITVAVDNSGTSVHKAGPTEWQTKIDRVPVAAG